MDKKKWKKILLWTISVIVLLGIGGLFSANYAMNKLISTLAADLESDLLTVDKPSIGVANGDGLQTNETETEDTDKSEQASNSQTGQEAEDPKGSEKPIEGYSAEVSVDKAKAVQEEITVSEKAQITSVLLKQLNMSDIKTLQALANGGLNKEEKKEARSIVLGKLSAEQYDELIKVAQKYGLSKGRTYDEVVKEK